MIPLVLRRWSVRSTFLLSLLGCAFAPALVSAEPQSLHQSLVQVLTTANPPDLFAPWRYSGPESWSGSGVILEGQRILTAAHVVSDRVMVEVRRAGDGRRYTAKVQHICHPCDLALLEVTDPAFFAETKPLPIGKLPSLQQPVEVHGFPKGGSGLSITSGIVSRIDVDYYVHSYSRQLLVQVDAAINSGNSGGPAISGGKIVGIAMQALDRAENIGYIVPAPIIRHFLEDIEDGRFDGFPELGFWAQSLENPDIRTRLGLGAVTGGVLVTAVSERASAKGALAPGDVLLAIDGVPIGPDGEVELDEGVRVDATMLEQRPQVGATQRLSIWRNGEKIEKTVTARTVEMLVPAGNFEGPLPYRVYAGLVFQPLSGLFLGAFGQAPTELLNYYMNPLMGDTEIAVPGRGIAGRRQIVVLTKVLATELTRGYENLANAVVLSVNGTTVHDLAHLSELIDGSSDRFVEITLEQGNRIVFDREAAAAAHPEILKRYQINKDRSP